MKVTELKMANSFELFLREQFLSDFSETVIREFDGRYGVPDFVIPICKESWEDANHISLTALASSRVAGLAQVVSALEATPCSENTLISRTGLTRQTVRKACRELSKYNFLNELEGQILLSTAWHIPLVEFWAFELKLSDWKGAIHQSLKYSSFTTATTIVLPPEKRKNIQSHLFERFDLGVAFYEPNTFELDWFNVPTAKAPRSRTHYLNAFMSFLRYHIVTQKHYVADFPISKIPAPMPAILLHKYAAV